MCNYIISSLSEDFVEKVMDFMPFYLFLIGFMTFFIHLLEAFKIYQPIYIIDSFTILFVLSIIGAFGNTKYNEEYYEKYCN